MSTVAPISDAKAEEIRKLGEEYGIDRIRVFGSWAQGKARPDSDIDLLVRLKPGHGFSDFMAFCEKAEAVLGRRVDVVTEDGLSPYLRDRVLNEAVAL